MKVWVERNGKRWRVRYREFPGGPNKTAETVKTKRESLQLKRNLENCSLTQKYTGQILTLSSLATLYVEARLKEGGMSEGNAHMCKQAVEKTIKETRWKYVTDITPITLRNWRENNATIGKWRHLRAVLRWAMVELSQPVDQRILIRAPRANENQKRTEPKLMPDDLVAQVLQRAIDIDPHTGCLMQILLSLIHI